MTALRSGYVVADDGSLEIVANVNSKAREDRLKAALRENLKRRKAQARSRQEADRDDAPVAQGPQVSNKRAE